MVGQRDRHTVFEDKSETELAEQLKMLEQDLKALQLDQKSLRLEVLQLKSDRDAHALILGDLYINEVASEALQFALGEQPKAAGQCSQFKVLARKNDSRLSRLVKIFNDNHVLQVDVTASSIASTLDSVIDSRNSAVHVDNRSLADLLDKMSKALELLGQYPSLQKTFSQEYMVLENYDMIRKAFQV